MPPAAVPPGAREWSLSTLLVQVEVAFAADQREHVADLLEPGAEQDLGVASVTLRPQDVEVRLRVAERVWPLAGYRQAVAAGVLHQRRGQGHRPLRGVALVNLKFSVKTGIRN